MNDISIIGIDPGAVHTGCVRLDFNTASRDIYVTYAVINGVDVAAVRDWVDTHSGPIFIEDYNPGNYAREDKRMSEALGRLKAEFPPSDDPIIRYVDNAGVNTIVPRAVLEVFGVAKFPIATNHNDLVSAAKIALLGMIQDKHSTGLRQLVSRVVKDELWGPGHGWLVVHNA